jgi:hypothetical protein
MQHIHAFESARASLCAHAHVFVQSVNEGMSVHTITRASKFLVHCFQGGKNIGGGGCGDTGSLSYTLSELF